MNKIKQEVDKKECFARLAKEKCNALSKKECENCSFYQHYSQVKGYDKYLPKGFTRLIDKIDKK